MSSPPIQEENTKRKASCFSNIKIFLVSECALMLAQGTVGAYLVSVLTTLERRFNLQSADVGVIASSFEIGNLTLILFVSYFGARAHRPRLIGCGGIVMALGALLSALPEFLTNQHEYKSSDVWKKEHALDMCSNVTKRDIDDGLCSKKANTNMMYLLLIGAQMLLGIGATPVQPLGVSYIDDHVSVLTTLERRFNLQSADVGVIASSFEIGNLTLILFVSYFGARAHRPRLIGCGGIVMALGALLSALPEFLTNQHEYKSSDVWKKEHALDMCSNVTKRDIDDGLCSKKANTNMMYLLLIGAQMLLGIGATPVQPLGVSYIDDHVRKKDSSLYIGILFSTLVFGPACGFILGSVCTKFYVDAVFVDTTKLDITPDDPRWIGAWWAGFLLCGAFLFFSAVLMFGFPSSPSERYGNNRLESDHTMLPVSQSYGHPKPSNDALHNRQSNSSCCNQLRVIPKVTKHLLSNPVFTCIVLAACMEIAVVAGFAAFLGKYLEQQFNLTTTSANQLLGMTAIPCACLGIFMGGLLVRKLNLCALGAVRMAVLVNLISTACYVSFLFLGCDTGPVAGVTIAYDNETLQQGQTPDVPCISNCNCHTSSISPVCGSNGVTYLSSCFAGCTRSISTGVLPQPAQNLTWCTCISGDGISSTVVPGKCPRPGCQEAFLIFLCILCACSMIGAMAQTPSVIILIRTVSPELKSYALGVLFLLLRLLGFIPPPLIFGVGIDSTCLFWSSECNTKGACMLYDNVAYRHLYVSLAIVLKIIAFLLYTTTWQCLRCNYKKYIKNNEVYVTSTEIFSSDINLDNLGKDNRTKFIYNLEDHEWCENMESVL